MARELFVSMLACAPTALKEDLRLAASLSDEARLYYQQGENDRAEQLYRRSLAIREKALGPDHPDVATSLDNLAKLYQAQGKYAEAAWCQTSRPPKDSKTLETYTTLINNSTVSILG